MVFNASITHRLLIVLTGFAALGASSVFGKDCEEVWSVPIQQSNARRIPKSDFQSWIHRDTRLVKIAEEASSDDLIQEEINDLIYKYALGNNSPGTGSINLGGGFVELRARRGGRVIIKVLSPTSFAIVGKSSKKLSGNEARMFRVLYSIYPELPPFSGTNPRQR